MAEGDGRIPAGCCVITAGVLILGVRHGCEQFFDATDAEFQNNNLSQERIPEFSGIFKQALRAAALSFDTEMSSQGLNFCIHLADLGVRR